MTAPTWPGDGIAASQGEGPDRRLAGGSGGVGTGRRRGAGRPTRARTRQESRRTRLVTALAKAATPALRVSAAADYVRASLGDLPPARSQQVGAEAVEYLIRLVDQAVQEEARNR
jgi:hypothetical protein